MVKTGNEIILKKEKVKRWAIKLSCSKPHDSLPWFLDCKKNTNNLRDVYNLYVISWELCIFAIVVKT